MRRASVRIARRLVAGGDWLAPSLRKLLRSTLTPSLALKLADRSSLLPGVALIGYPRGEFGLGQALRNLAAGAERALVPYNAVDIDHGIWARQNDRRLAGRISGSLNRRVNLLVHSPASLRLASRLLGSAAFAGRHNIFYAFWELPELPEAWIPDLKDFQEFWAPSRFVARALEARLQRPVFVLPPPITLPTIPHRQRSDFGLPADRFLFWFVFDFSSGMDRKNPEAVVQAFHQCAASLPPGRVGLVLKVMGADVHRNDRRRLERAIDGMTDVFIIDAIFDWTELLALQSVCDCLVSLHRSEGFGLAIVEAMALGKPVIATCFGGATDLLEPTRSCPVTYRAITVLRDQYPNGEGQNWADPDIKEAAASMRRIYENKEWGRMLGAAGRAYVESELSPERIGTLMRQRLAPNAGISAVL